MRKRKKMRINSMMCNSPRMTNRRTRKEEALSNKIKKM